MFFVGLLLAAEIRLSAIHFGLALYITIFDKKLNRGIQNKKEQSAVLEEFHLFCIREKLWNSVSNHFSEVKNPQKSVPNHLFSNEKNLGIPYRTIFEREKPRNSV
jgi:hypothetical protein